MTAESAEAGYCLFQQPWWLDAAAPGAWDAVEVVEDGKVMGRLSFSLERQFGLRMLTQPKLTPFCGPWLRTPQGKLHSRLAEQDRIVSRLIGLLPRYDVFNQRFHYDLTRWMAFYWSGFSQSTRFSYRIGDTSNLDAVWSALQSNARTQIRRAERAATVDDRCDVSELLGLARLTYRRRGMLLPFNEDMVHRLNEACSAREQCKIFAVRDQRGDACAAAFVVWDDRAVYYLIGGVDSEKSTDGTMKLLIWHAIKWAHSIGRLFDFEGSMIRSIEQFFRQFGGEPVGYSHILGATTRVGSLALAAARLVMEQRRGGRDER